MWFLRLLLVLVPIASLSARTAPIRRYDAEIVPLALTQDRDGLLWLATATGVLTFDGLHFDPVRPPAGIDLSRATHITAGPDGSIWIGTARGLILHRDGVFRLVLPGAIKGLLVTRAGRVLAAVGDGNASQIALDPNHDPTRWSTQRSISVTGEFHEDLQGKVWFGCSAWICSGSDADLKAIAEGRTWQTLQQMHSMPGSAGDAKTVDWADVVALPDGHIWARNGPDIVVFENGRIASKTALPAETFDGAHPQFFLDRRGRLWIPGRDFSFVDNGRIQPFTGGAPPLEKVTAVFEDRRGTLWFGLAGEGLAALPDESSLEAWSEAEGISGSVLDLGVHPKLGLLAATDSGQYSFAENQNRWLPVGSAENAEAWRSIAAGSDGAVLSLPYRGGLLLSAPPFRSPRELPLPAGMESKWVKKLYRDPRGVIWIGGIPGLLRLDPDKRVRQIPLPAGGTYATDFWTDPEGQLWVGYEGGVAHCQGEVCAAVIAPKDGLLNPRIRSIAPASDEVWVAYRASGGFTRFQKRDGIWTPTHFRPENGYGPADTHFLRRDRRGWIWRGSTDGVYVSDGKRIDPEDWVHLTFGDRVNASYANMYGFYEQPDGAIWIGTQTGIVRVHPRDDWFVAAPPKLGQITLPRHVREDLEIHLSRPQLPPFQSRLFRYRLAPADSEWRFSSDGTLRYAKLAPGEYRLQLASGGGVASVEYPLRIDGAPGIGTWGWISISFMAVSGLALAVLKRRRSSRAEQAKEDYWNEKRQFLESRDTADPAQEDWSGTLVDGRFLLGSRIASGGFAAVYRAADTMREHAPVAMKLFYPVVDHMEWRRRRFEEEVAALQKLRDPGIVQILHSGEAAQDRPYLAMEYLDGVTLRAVLRDGPLEINRAAGLLEQIGAALAAAHRAEVLHRDLKPENVMVLDAGSANERIKLIDFGIARIHVNQTRTHSTQLAGSPGYVAPERWVGLETYASDVYSMAAMAVEMLAGEPITDLRLRDDSLESFRIPRSAADLLSAALAYEPEKRPSDPELFARDLSICLCSRSKPNLATDERR